FMQVPAFEMAQWLELSRDVFRYCDLGVLRSCDLVQHALVFRTTRRRLRIRVGSVVLECEERQGIERIRQVVRLISGAGGEVEVRPVLEGRRSGVHERRTERRDCGTVACGAVAGATGGGA